MMASVHPAPKEEEDFEMVLGYSHETDDLSSITATSSEADNESLMEDTLRDPMDVTFQMPDLSSSSIHTEKAFCIDAKHSRRDDPWTKERTEDDAKQSKVQKNKIGAFDLDDHEKVELPILYLGPTEHKTAVLHKLMSALVENFTDDVWTSDSYCIVPGSCLKGGTPSQASLRARSRLYVTLLSGVDDLRFRTPFLIVRVVDGKSSVGDDEHIAMALKQDSTLLSISSDSQSSNDAELAVELPFKARRIANEGPRSEEIDKQIVGPWNMTLEELKDISIGELSVHLMDALDKWANDSHTTKIEEERWFEGMLPAIKPLLAAVCFAMFCALLWPSLSHFVSKSEQGLLLPNTRGVSSITFHQITETVTLIELPMSYRARSADMVPMIDVSVSRAGKTIASRLKLSIDNIYTLDWSPSEAYGELLVAAQLQHADEPLTEAYLVQYSTGKSFRDTLVEKFRELDHSLKGIAANIELDRRLEVLTKQVEEQRSYAIGAYHTQVNMIKAQGSEGLKRFHDEYTSGLHKTSESFNQLWTSGTKWTQKAKRNLHKHTHKTFKQAGRGMRKLERDVRKRLKSP